MKRLYTLLRKVEDFMTKLNRALSDKATMVSLFSVQAFTSCMDDTDWAIIHIEFTAGATNLMMATTTFRFSININDVILTLHHGTSCLLKLQQQALQGSWRSKLSMFVLLLTSKQAHCLAAAPLRPGHKPDAPRRFVATDGCRKRKLCAYLDNSAVYYCAEFDAAQCNLCLNCLTHDVMSARPDSTFREGGPLWI